MRLPADPYDRIWFEIERSPDNTNFVVNDVSFTKMSCDPQNLVLNGDLETGNSRYWDTWGGSVKLEVVDGFGGPGSNALRSSNRAGSTWHNFAQLLNLDCANTAYERLSFSARIKFDLNGAETPCNPFHGSNFAIPGVPTCVEMYLHTDNRQGTRRYEHAGMVSATSEYDADGWYLISGTLTLKPDMVGPNMHSKLHFINLDPAYSTIIDNAEIKVLPQQCSALVLNPSVDNGSMYWQTNDRHRAKLDLYSPGASGGSDVALRSFERDHWWRGMRQRLDPRCFASGDEYVINAKFRLLDAAGQGVMCDVNKQWTTTDVCPSVAIYGFQCTGNNVYWRFYNALGGDDLAWDPDAYNNYQAAFTVNDELATCKDFWVYIHEVNYEYSLVLDDLQIESLQTEAPTIAPTHGSTAAATEGASESPTGSPTTRPTVAAVTSCPADDSSPTEIPSGPVMLARSSSLCVLTKAIPDAEGNLTSIAPVALSYDGGDWENAAGDFATALLRGQEFKGYASGSHITLPALGTDEKYYLTSYSHAASETDKLARLLESATFGTTAGDLQSWNKGPVTTATAKAWIQEQIDLPVTSHRAFFRQRSNGRLTNPVRTGRSNHPCDDGSIWRIFAFSRKEGQHGVIQAQKFQADYNLTDTYVTIRLNGHVRTVIKPDLAFDDSAYTFEYNREYDMCGAPENWAEGRIWLRMEDQSCQILYNPLVHFYGDSVQPEHVLSLPAISEGGLKQLDELNIRGGEYMLTNGGLTDSLCEQLPDFAEEAAAPVFGQLPDGSWLQFDPTQVLDQNTLESHLPDGGGLVKSLTEDETRCSNVPRTFLNEEHCELSHYACGSAGTPNLLIPLNADNIMDMHNITGQYVYGILGLPLIDAFGNKQPWPCELGLRSRWEILDEYECTQTTMGDLTNATLTELLADKGASDENPFVRDIIFPILGSSCDSSDTALVEVDIIIGSKCFRRVHPDHMSVYDCECRRNLLFCL
jgi:hypothetical protein